MLINFSAADVPDVPIRNRKAVKEVLLALFKNEGKELSSLTYIFTSDKFLLEVNRKFLHHDFYTDVITFNLSETSHELIGEVYISLPRVRENAATEKISVKEELRRVILHGALHLCGYKDKRKREIRLMREAENKYLRYFDF